MNEIIYGVGGNTSLNEFENMKNKVVYFFEKKGYYVIRGKTSSSKREYDCYGFFDFTNKNAFYLIDKIFNNGKSHPFRAPILSQNSDKETLKQFEQEFSPIKSKLTIEDVL